MAGLTAVPSTSDISEDYSPVSEFELSSTDLDEAGKVDTFFSNGCGCKLGPKKTACSSVISRHLATTTRNDCLQLERSELDVVILSQLQALRTHPDQPVQRQSSGLSTQHTTFYFHTLRVCLNAFLFIHAINHKRFESLQKHIDSVGAKPKGRSATSSTTAATSLPSTSATPAELPLPLLGAKRRRLCSICSNPGHNKKTCPNNQ